MTSLDKTIVLIEWMKLMATSAVLATAVIK